ncbi:tRNA (N(6)-L-threonylcarbamoyladenosine(37)-C(2))-methylthiotransferase MtaB [uncultured Fusobacterium sp.]|uniref:tRNA (N(6)-L-threonylcarbamoyladenosine(37)-C(2))- methylthiotransferase MtaB n=1 Tax=uncultured Fusobacterium sp. TaxID=159267 RepID=UPI0025FB7022|nr:tRNA (N(6)-L-threonylcarbamoyladenosine(37)-C(2))-methylthiotransferase MtaB [uncultured Fusobacterium sp.]
MNFNKKVAFYTLGCKVNQYETESIKNQLLQKGYTETSFEEKADIYIVNSCTVTSVADRKTRNMLRRAKKINPQGKVIVTGCYAQTNSKELLEMEEIDYVVGNRYKKGIVNFIEDIENRTMERLKNDNIFDEYEYTEYEFATLREMSRAYVKIQDGCNNFCSYCKIPFARGKSRSRKKDNILREIEKLVAEGFKEVILIGINLGAYGEDLEENIDFEDLLEEILQIKGLERVRIGSVYPDKISDRFIEMFKYKNLMPHLHISLQSCDDTVLKMMKRKYGSALIEERLLKLKNSVENMEYTADIIVGFPGETEEMFQNSYNLIEKIGFSGLHIFQYSDRENTVASHLENKIDSKTKKERADRLEELKKVMAIREREHYLEKNLKVLIEEKIEDSFYGYSENYLRVKIDRNHSEIKENDIVDVKITSLEKELLVAYE